MRVRSVAKDGRLSRVVTVRVQILMPLPPLAVGSPISVGPGAGVPAAGDGEVWVPTTGDGMLVRVSGGVVASRTRVGPPGGDGFLDSAVRAGELEVVQVRARWRDPERDALALGEERSLRPF